MQATTTDSPRHYALPWAALLFAGVAHAAHDTLGGDRLLPALLPTLGFALQAAVLSLGQGLAERRKWSFAATWAGAALTSVACGMVTVAIHPARAHSRVGLLLASAAAGAGVLMLWLLLFYFPTQLGRARTRALAAENEQRKAELERLRANLQPHFLLNTLNAVAGLLIVQPHQARQLVIALGDLLRDSLEDQGGLRSLAEETAWLERYAQILEIRHAGALQVVFDLAPATLTAQLPRLLLQPLLENAIKHGALRRPGGGKVTLRSRQVDGAIEIAVADDGPGMAPDQPWGLGLHLVKDRLHLAYPGGALAIETSGVGTCVSLRLPTMENPR